MDALTHMQLDRLREAQMRHSETLQAILQHQRLILKRLAAQDGPAKSASSSTPLTTLSSLLKLSAVSAGQWAGGIFAMAWVMKGGDIITAIEAILKFLPHLS